jgi:tetratricopeptide (TPR) repeat protein
LTEASLEIARRCGDVRRTTSDLDNLGFFWQQRGDLERAAELHQESLALARAIGDVSLVGAALTNLGSTERQRGELTAAQAALKESLGILRDTGDRSRDVADVLEELAATFAMEGDDRRALMLFAAAEGIRDAVAYPLREFFRRMYDPIIGTARGHLSDDTDAWKEGRLLPIDAAIDLAFAGLSH